MSESQNTDNNRLEYLESIITSVGERYDRPNEPRSINEICYSEFGEDWSRITKERDAIVSRIGSVLQ